LFTIAIIHVLYLIPFLDTFAALASHADVSGALADDKTFRVRHLIDTLADYKKNMWIIVGNMCITLSTSCFILLLSTSSPKLVYDIAVSYA
uniref:Aa_trans domain-containing protein n=1 Tax=Gongylonema pulchrum TaxID=637853 RepID=A0A183DM14_9BILA